MVGHKGKVEEGVVRLCQNKTSRKEILYHFVGEQNNPEQRKASQRGQWGEAYKEINPR